MTARNDFVLGTSVSFTDEFIPESKLPSEENVLRAYLYINKKLLSQALPGQQKSVNKKSSDETINLIKKIYDKAGIQTITDEGIRHQIYRLHEQYKKLSKVSMKKPP